MTKYTVVINNDTTGTIDDDTLDGKNPENFIGEMVTINSHDENGNPIEHKGRLTEILESF